MAIAKLSSSEITTRLVALPGWSLVNDKLHREYELADFVAAFALMVKVAMIAERMGHHPEWFNVYNKLIVDLTTHDAGGISAIDFDLATAIEKAHGAP